MIYACTYSEMINLQLIVSGTLANAGHPEGVTNKKKRLFVPCCGTFCAVLWHILCRPVAHKSFCAVLWHILCRPVAHKPKSLFVPCTGTFCAFPWHMVFCSLLSRIASQELPVKNCQSRIASQELQVKNCKSKIASQELQVKNCKSRIASQELQKKVF
jgi:hypothetical protein